MNASTDTLSLDDQPALIAARTIPRHYPRFIKAVPYGIRACGQGWLHFLVPQTISYFRKWADFYFTNPIARSSRVMAECSAIAYGRTAKAVAE